MSPAPPAPLDLGRLEAEARSNAAKHVANLLQKPDQLEKVDQYKRRVARKKASVEAMLKTAVQSQLDGVRTGLNQLQSALQDVYEIKQSLDEIDEAYKSVSSLKDKLKQVRDENSQFSQLAAAVENLKHIFTVPESVRRTQEYINDGKLLLSHKHLTDLQMSRDDLLFELHRQPQQSPTDKNTLKLYFADVEKLSDSLGKQLWLILHRTLMSVRREPTIIVTALRIIEREERLNTAILKRQEQTGFLPPGRPKKWRERCFQVLEESISSRIEGNQSEDRSSNKMWLVRHLEITRQLMIDDLRVVKTLLPPIFPPEYAILKRYIKMYHRALSQHLRDLISQQLEGNEYITLLTWVNAYDSPELMKSPDLNIDTKDLHPLLENNVLNNLQDEFLVSRRKNIVEWMHNALTSDMKDWYRDELPDTDKDQYYNTALSVIIFQMMDQNLQVGQIVGQDLVKKILQLFADELNLFGDNYKSEINNYKDKHLQNRSKPKYFTQYMIAHINNCLSFGDYIKQLRKRYLEEEGKEVDEEEEEETNIRKDRFQMLTEKFMRTATFGCKILLEVVFLDLRTSGQLEHLMTKQWRSLTTVMSMERESMLLKMTSSDAVETICATLEDYNSDFEHLKPRVYFILMFEAQRRILKEYLKALLSRKLSFKNYEERRESAEKICKEANQLMDLFTKLSPTPQKDTSFSVLSMLAEVIRLRDTSMLSLEITGLVNKYPDIRMEQLINLLLCRGDMSRSDARQMVLDTLGEENQLKPKPKGIFSDIAAA